jgi:3-hydroxyisobutyrate dehydrogenase
MVREAKMAIVGIAGTGRMGTAFAKRLIDQGHTVKVWNRSKEKTIEAEKWGAIAVNDLEELPHCDAILTSLTDAMAVYSVVDALIKVGVNGGLIIDMSTLLPSEEVALEQQLTSVGCQFVDCPVGGTVGPALKGQLLGMAGGTTSAFQRAKPILNDLCKRVEHVGPAGSGARMKLAINLPLAIYWQTLGEAMSLLSQSGIDTETAISLIADSSGGTNVLKNRSQVVIDTFGGQDQQGTFNVEGLTKDLRLALQLASAEGRLLRLARTVEEIYSKAIEDGMGQFDGASLSSKAAK